MKKLPYIFNYALLTTIVYFCSVLIGSNGLYAKNVDDSPIILNELDNLKFKHFTANEGFYGNAVYKSLKDRSGNMWFTTWNGLFKYDGNRLFLVTEAFEESSKLRSLCKDLLEDDANRIWTTTNDGLVIWDDKYNQEYPLETIGLSNKVSSRIRILAKGRGHSIWMIGKKLLWLYNQDTNALENHSELLSAIESDVIQIYTDREQKTWIVTAYDGVFLLESRLENHKTCSYKLVRYSPFSKLIACAVNSMFQDSNKNYWFALEKGVALYKNVKGSELVFWNTNQAIDKNNFSEIIFRNFVQCDELIYASTSHGIFVYSLINEKFKFIQKNSQKEYSLTANSVFNVYVDDEKGLWISTFHGGVNYLSYLQTRFFTRVYLNRQIGNYTITTIAEDNSRQIWMGLDGNGVCCWNRQNNTLKYYDEHSDFKLTSNKVQGIYVCDDKLFIGTFGSGLDIIDLKSYQKVNFNQKNTYPDPISSKIYSIERRDDESVWVGTRSALYTLNWKTGETHLVKQPRSTSIKILVNKNRDLWTCNDSCLSVFHFINQSWTEYNTYPSLFADVNTMAECNDGVYLGTKRKGLWKFNTVTHRLDEILVEDLKNVIIHKIIPTDSLLWISTNRGLYKYDLLSRSADHFTYMDGLRSNLYRLNSGICTSDGLIMLGGINGVDFFYPNRIKNTTTVPKVILTDFYVLNKVCSTNTENSPLPCSVNYLKSLTLHEKYHNFAFRFSSSNHCNTEKNVFQYKLEPYETNWQSLRGGSCMAYYNNLPAGNYTFRVRTDKGAGICSEEKVVAVKIVPFWWKTVYMKSVYVLVTMAFIGFLFIKYKAKKNRELRILLLDKEKQVYRSKVELFTVLIHEIRTPLTLILGPLTGILNQKKNYPLIVPELQMMERNGQRLLMLVNQLMDFRKIEERSYEVYLHEQEISTVLNRVVEDFSFLANTKHITFEKDIPQEECWAKVDKEALTKIISNLLSNAFKFTKDYVCVSLSLSANKRAWEIQIRDNGCGVDVSDQEKIFNSFFQVKDTLPSDYVGTGIGLFVVRKLVEMQGGTISVNSQKNNGTAFIVSFPSVPSDAHPDHIIRDACELNGCTEHELPNTANKQLLVVDDNIDMCEYITSILKDAYSVSVCYNGKDALELVSKNDFDLIITDLMMPVMSREKLCKSLKETPVTSHIPVIVLTAKTDENSQSEVLGLGADVYVTKPFSAVVLRAQINSLISNREELYAKFYRNPEVSADTICTNDVDQIFIQKLDKYLYEHLSESNLEIDSIAMELALGRSAFYKKVKALTGLTPNDYLRTLRLKTAVALLKQGKFQISEVCYQVGFTSPSYFTKRFSQQYGCSPSDYLRQNGIEVK